jgi:hypothetical protein
VWVILVVGGIILYYIVGALIFGPPLVLGAAIAEWIGSDREGRMATALGSAISVAIWLPPILFKMSPWMNRRIRNRHYRYIKEGIRHAGRPVPLTPSETFWKTAEEGAWWLPWLVFVVLVYGAAFLAT